MGNFFLQIHSLEKYAQKHKSRIQLNNLKQVLNNFFAFFAQIQPVRYSTVNQYSILLIKKQLP